MSSMTEPRPVCQRCNQVHTKCTGHRHGDGQPCGMWPKAGLDVCRKHGGAAPQVKAAGERRMREEKMKQMAATYGAPRDVGPNAFLLELVSISAGAVWWLKEIISELDPQALVYGEKQTSHQEGRGPEGPVDITTTVHGATASEWWSMYLAEREHGRKVSEGALKAGVDEREIRLAEQLGERAGRWLRASVEGEVDQAAMHRIITAGVQNMHLLEGTGS